MEKALSNAILRMFYKDDIGDSLFCPGGSFANGNAIYLARFWFNKRYEVINQSSFDISISLDLLF